MRGAEREKGRGAARKGGREREVSYCVMYSSTQVSNM